MEKIKDWQIWVFVGGLLGVAIIVNYLAGALRSFAAHPSSTPVRFENMSNELVKAERIRQLKQSIAKQQASEEAADRHTNNLGRYVNPGFARKSDLPVVAVAVATEASSFDSDIAALLASRLNLEKLAIASGLFTPEFVSDGLFTAAFNGSRKLYSDLELSNAVDVLLLGRETITYGRHDSLQGIITADFRLDVSSAPVVWVGQSRGWSYAAKGAGFSQADARAQALERISRQINTDTNHFSAPWYTRP